MLPDEQARLNELRNYNILDTMLEKDFDDITQLASIICNVPISLISFIDQDRQWFKSHLGVSVSETVRAYSFCDHAIHASLDIFIIPDTRLDNRFKDNPLVTHDPHVVFYAGVPLVTNNGYGLGTVCVVDTQPRQLASRQIAGLKILADRVMQLLEVRRAINNPSLSDVLEVKNREFFLNGKQINVSLDEQLSNHMQKLAQFDEQQARLNAELLAFNYITNHDLQEPLRKIQLFSTLILKHDFDSLSPRAQQYFNIIEKASNKLSALINALLAYSQATVSEPFFETIALKDVVEEVKVNLQELIDETNAQIEVTGYCYLTVITKQFTRLMENIISNAIKFARPGVPSKVLIGCKFDTGHSFGEAHLAHNQEYFCITVADNGMGFDNRFRGKIFEIFQRLNAPEVQTGTGIGLAIAKKIAENHGGFITATAIENEGATFKIYIPVICEKQALN